MRIFFLSFLMFCSFNAFAQENSSDEEFFKMLGGKQVILNKTVVAYSVYKSNKVNGVESQSSNNPDIKKPYKIYIKSNEDEASIRINNKELREDIFLHFTKILKVKQDDNSYHYQFIDGNGCRATYMLPKNDEHQELLVDCESDGENRQMLIFTISKLDQL